jgi:hypothetical protein
MLVPVVPHSASNFDVAVKMSFDGESRCILIKFKWCGDSFPNEHRGPFRQRENKHTAFTTKTERSIGSSYSHAILELLRRTRY